MLNWLKNLVSAPTPAGPEQMLHRFEETQATISEDIRRDAGGWRIDAAGDVTLRLFELEPGEIENGMIAYRASLKSEAVGGRAYLELWCRFPGKGEFFSKGFHNAIKGSNDWAVYEVPFYLKKSQQPDLLKLNLVVEGGGEAWIKDVEVGFTPFK